MSDETRVIDSKKTTPVAAKINNDYLVEIYGKHLGKKYNLNGKKLIIGRGINCDIKIDSDITSRRHVLLQLNESNKWTLVDLDSTNGTWIDGFPVKKAVLTGGEQIKIGDVILKFLSGDKVETLYFETIYRMMIFDGLTEVFNRRYAFDFLEKEFSRAKRYSRNLSVLFIDLDDFKRINDTYGHLAGDFVLKQIATEIKTNIRREEIVARYGGDEFLVIIPEADLKNVKQFTTRIKNIVKNNPVKFDSESIKATISIGVGMITSDMTKPEDLIKLADKNLYISKKQGKNKIVF